MSLGAPWSVKGIDPKAREIAKDLARREGLTLGEWLNRMIMEDDGGAPEPQDQRQDQQEAPPRLYVDPVAEAHLHAPPAAQPSRDEVGRVSEALERLSARIEAAEQRSTLAINGVDQSVRSLLTRMDAADREHTAVAARFEGAVDELKTDHSRTASRVRRIEAEAAGPRSAEALRALEQALGKVANHLYEGETKMRDRVAALEARAGEAASQGGEGVSASAVEAITARLNERLEQAERRTSEALRGLSTSFNAMDGRLRSVEGDGGAAAAGKLEQLAASLSQGMEAARLEMAAKLHEAAEGRFERMERKLAEMGGYVRAAEHRSAQALDKMGREVMSMADALNRRLQAAETRSADLIDQVGGEMSRIASTVEQKLDRVDNAQAAALERLGGEISRITERLAERIAAAERRSAIAMDDVGEQMGRLGERLTQRHETAADEMAERFRQSEARTAGLIEEARQRMEASLANQRRLIDAVSAPPAEPVWRPEPLARTTPEPEAATFDVAAFEAPSFDPALFDAPSAPEADPFADVSPLAFVTPEPEAVAPEPAEAEAFADLLPAEPAEDIFADPLLADEADDDVFAEIEQAAAIAYRREEPADEIFALEPVEAHDAPVEDLVDLSPLAAGPSDELDLDILFQSLGSEPLEPLNLSAEPDVAPVASEARVVEIDVFEPSPQIDAADEFETPAQFDDEDFAAAPLDDPFAADAFAADPFSDEALFTGGPEPTPSPFTAAPATEAFAPSPGFEAPEQEEPAAPEAFAPSPGFELPAEPEPEAQHPAEDLAAFEPLSELETLNVGLGHDDEPFDAETWTPSEESFASAEEPQAAPLVEPALELPVAPPVLPPLDPARPLTTKEVVEQARAAARAAMQAGSNRKKGLLSFGKGEDDGAPGRRRNETTTLRTALIVSGVSAALGVGFAGYVLHARPHGGQTKTAAAGELPIAEGQKPPAPPVARAQASVAVESIPAAIPPAGPAPAENVQALYEDGARRLGAGDKAGLESVRRAANLGYAPAQFHLAKLYEAGEDGLKKDLTEARRWTERAALGGETKAMHNLALYYYEGEAGPKNLTAAADWFRKAADLGLAVSQDNLGRFYEEGLGVLQNGAEAYKWYLIAATSGDVESRADAARLKRTLSPEAQSVAERSAAAFRAQVLSAPAVAAVAQADPTGGMLTAQRALTRLGYYRGPQDGASSPALRLASAAYQRDQQLAATGVLDPALTQKLAVYTR